VTRAAIAALLLLAAAPAVAQDADAPAVDAPAVNSPVAAPDAGAPGPVGGVRVAPSCPDPAVVQRALAAYDAEVDRAGTWNTGWAIAYGVFAVGQVGMALAEFSPGRDFEHAAAVSLYAGAGKALLGMGSRIVLPLRPPRVHATGDACVDAAALDRARAVAARKERNTFWLQLGGGMALHAAVGGYLVIEEDAWRDAIMSLAVGVVVSGVTLYTLPRQSWWHGERLMITPSVAPGSAGLAVAGTF